MTDDPVFGPPCNQSCWDGSGAAGSAFLADEAADEGVGRDEQHGMGLAEPTAP